jgi:hypothetical protein
VTVTRIPHPRARRSQRGAGLLGTLSGLTVFLVLVLFAVQVAIGLYARSLVTAAAYDAARNVAGYASAGSRLDARRVADDEFHRRLGRFGRDRARLEWEAVDDPDVVRVRVQARHPSLLPAAFTDALGIGATDRRIEVRVERFR